MLGLGNGRRGMKSPPLLVAVLLACVLVLGINYWISNSRSIELQAMLVKNLTFKDQLIAQLQGEMRELVRKYDVLQDQMKEVQESQSRKLAFELEQCSNKMNEIKDQCEERLKKLSGNLGEKVEVQAQPEPPKNQEPQKRESDQLNVREQEEKDKHVNNVAPQPSSIAKGGQVFLVKEDQGNEKNSEIVDGLNVVHLQEKGAPGALAPPPNPSKDLKEGNPLQVGAAKENDPYDGEDKLEAAEDEDARPEEPANQHPKKEINNEEVEREQFLNLDDQEEKEMTEDDGDQAIEEQDTENEVAKLPDYNGEEGNEPEPEAKKQAELAGNEIQLKGPMDNKDMNNQELARQKEEQEQRLK
ncbi:Golgi membrane protein 1 isoform X2 [Ambystoma mexicanum]|uniref:Golgi membrane protein 1 isoform X2 n=1 Tax=Ambystoma mexicanum TaxID=8296 RepID=UPI0037E7574B